MNNHDEEVQNAGDAHNESDLPSPAIGTASPNTLPLVVEPLLFVSATTHNDLEQQRIASQNRLRILTATEPDEDGVVRGFGLDERHPDVARLTIIVDGLTQLEHDAELGLKHALRRCAIHPWVLTQKGLGEKQFARLLAAIGDPYWNTAKDQPRTVSQLWAYCGLHVLPAGHFTTVARGADASGDPASQSNPDTPTSSAGQSIPATREDGASTSDPGHSRHDTQSAIAGVAARRRRGQQANWSTDAKTRAYLCATSCIKQSDTPYRLVYDKRRAHTAKTHPDWTPGHSHNDGLRIVAKEILKQAWREARRLHTGETEG